MNPFLIMWRFALAVLLLAVSITTWPVMFIFTGTFALASLLVRKRRERRQARRSWSHHPTGRRRASGYRRQGHWA